MHILKLIPVIIKNLSLMIWENKISRWILIILIVAGVGFGGYKIFFGPLDPNDPNLSLSDAAKIGEVTTHKLMVQIENRQCPTEIASGCYERGDIVLIKNGDFEFSDAEKTGFLILKMDLTDKQAEVLVRSLEQKAKNQPKEKSPDGRVQMEQLKMRRYGVDLKKISIEDSVTSGKVVDAVYKWDIVKEKK